MNPKPSHSNQGFTLLEMLLVVAIIAVLAGIVVVAINPGKQLATVRNTERSFNLNEIHKAMQQYFIDHYIYPAATPTTLTEICNTGNLPYPSGIDCGTLIDLSPLVPTYLTSIPVDPQGSTLSFINNFIPKVYATTNGTGYKVMKDSDNKIVLSASQAELGVMIRIGTITECTATGGTKTTSGNYCIHTFTSGTSNFSVPSGSLSCDILVVGGGGGTANSSTGGGGGGGGVLYNAGVSITGVISVVVGLGGTAASGSNSSFGAIVATGGGYGANYCSGGGAGGSGGGSGTANGGSDLPGGIGVVGPPRQGYNGGFSSKLKTSHGFGSGGGGAGEAGEDVGDTVASMGGDGLEFPQFASVGGSPAGWFGGGGGGSGYILTGGVGGLGGGGKGNPTNGTAGVANTGGGAGGYAGGGGVGGSGIVIVRYLKQI